MAGDRAGYDQNLQPTLLAVSTADGVTPVTLEADPTTHALLTSGGGGGAGDASAANQVTGNASLASIDTKTPVLGQGLAAASVPVVLTAAQLTTLTPPAAITGFATAGKQPALGTAGVASTDVITVQGIASGTAITVSGAVGASSVTGAAIPANAFMIGVSDGTNLVALRQASNGLNTTAGGLLAVNNAAQFDDVSPTSITENSFGNLRISANRNLYTTMRDAAGNERGLNITSRNSLTAEGSTAAAVTLAAAPITVGGQAKTANPTAVTDGQVVNATYDKLGKQVVVGSLRDLKADAALTLTASTTETTLIAAIASTFNDLYGLIVTNISATACEVIFRDVAAGTPRFSIQVPPTETRGFMLPESAAYKQATVNTAWTAQCVTSVTSIKINALYVKNL